MEANTITQAQDPVAILHDVQNNNLNAETLMMQIQMLVTEDFNEQMEALGEKIKMLSKVKKAYRENINKIKQFMAQNANTSRKDGRHYYEASSEQLSKLFGSFVKYNYDLENCEFDPDTDYSSMEILDEQGYTDTVELQNLFNQIAALESEGDMEGASELAQTIGDDDNNLPMYYGHKNNTFEDGSPKFAVFADTMNAMLEEVQNFVSDVEEESEQLSVDLNQIASQRRSSLEGANELIRKMAEIKGHTISKMD